MRMNDSAITTAAVLAASVGVIAAVVTMQTEAVLFPAIGLLAMLAGLGLTLALQARRTGPTLDEQQPSGQ